MIDFYRINSSNAHIKVTTEDLRAKAEDAQKKTEDMKSCLQELTEILERTNYYWEGEAGDIYRSVYHKRDESIQRMIEKLEDYPVKLLTIAGIYEPAESANVQTSGELKTGIL